MTQTDLETFLRNGDATGLVAALGPLIEDHRRPLGKIAAAWFREWKKNKMQVIRDAIARTNQFSSNNPDYQKAELTESAAQLAVLGLCGWSEAKAIPAFIYPSPHIAGEHILAILRARRPDWLDQWVAKEIAGRSTNWYLIRTLVREGLCGRLTDPRYLIQMVGSAFGWRWDFNCSLADLLRRDPDLLENDFWQTFEIDLGDRQLLTIEDIDFDHIGAPSTAVRELVRTGEIDRPRILSATLSAPLHNSNPLNAGWFCRLHEKLEPSLDERCECQAAYLELLSSPFPPIVGFALDALKIIASKGRLDVRPFAQHIAPAFTTDKKAQAATALQILKLSAQHHPEEARSVALAAAHGLAHPKSDIQEKALRLVSSLVQSPDPILADAVEPHLPAIAASLRPAAQELLARLRASASPTSAVPEAPATGAELTTLLDQARAIPAPWHTLAGLDTCLAFIEQGDDLKPVTFDPMSVPRLDPASQLHPIESLDQLIEQLSAAIEGLDDADQFELLMDGMSRIAAPRPDFTGRTAPLLKRVNGLQNSPNRIYGPLYLLQEAIAAWITLSQPRFPEEMLADSRMPMSFIARRLAAMNARLYIGSMGPLLACPTHKGGWIDPEVLIARLLHWQAIAQAEGHPGIVLGRPNHPDRLDLIQALLRLAPENRPQALQQASALGDEVGIVVRYALSPDQPPPADVNLCIAAFRSREPSAFCSPLASHPAAAGPDAAAPVAISWSPAIVGKYQAVPTVTVRTTPPFPAPILTSQPTVELLHQGHRDWWGICTPLEAHCLASIWPANLQGHFIHAAGTIAARLDMPGSTFSPVATYLDPLFDPSTPFTELAQVALSIALISKDPGAKGLAIDALIALVDDGRCVGQELGPILAKLSTQSGFVHLNRLAAALQDLARISELHHYAAMNIATSLLASLAPPAPADLHHLLSFLHESLAATHHPLPASTHPILQSVMTSGKGGKAVKLAKSLLAHHPTPNPAWLAAVHTRALAGRLARANRWAAAV